MKLKYIGSKNRIAKHILPIILKDRKDGQWYVEPFVGGANMIDKVDGNRIGADFSEHVINALTLVRDNPSSIPCNSTEYTKEDRQKAIDEDSMRGLDCLMYFECSFGASFKGSWAVGHPTEDFVRAARNNAIKQSPNLQGVTLLNSSYADLDIPPNGIIYCDPPYEGTFKYKAVGSFNHDDFWTWCRVKHFEGHTVYISEYNAPDDFTCVWECELRSNANAKASSMAIEKLFTIV